MGREIGEATPRREIAQTFARGSATTLLYVSALALAALVLVAAAQPIFTDDAWWHLAMGEAYMRAGPWLEEDPLLYTAVGPPAAAAWLTDVVLHGIELGAGFTGLRVTHALLVAAFLGMSWALLWRAGRWAAFASLGTATLAALSAYRLFQLRPDLITMLAALLLVGMLTSSREPPSWRRVTACGVLFCLWANAHGGFVLGLVLLAAAVAGVVVAAWLGLAESEPSSRRARVLSLAWGVGFLATLINPAGYRQHLLYFTAGDETPALEVVADEWASVDLLTLPSAVIPPTPLAWLLVWILLLGTTLVLARSLVRAKRAAHGSDESDIDPALLAIAVVSLAGMLSAVRLLWLGIFPLLILAQASRGWRVRDPDSSASSGWILAVLSLLLVSAFVRVGDWPLVSRAIHPAWYGLSFSTIKYDTAAVWLLRDAEIEGNLFNDYTEGNFLAYWLRPRMGVFVNGSMNVPLEVMESRSAILDRRGAAPDESFASLLDRHDVDVFFGSGMPELATSVRTAPYTVAHLERTPGWLQVFRNMRGALYLRKNDKNVENLQRLTRYYARVGVPFDAERGFDPAAAIREANRWSVAHGLVPMSFSSLEGATRSLDPEQQIAARERLASIFALLGLYERSERLDRRRLRSEPDAIGPSRRLVWTRLHQGRYADARAAAEHLGAIAPADDTLSQILVSAAGIMRDLSDEEKRSVVASLPLLTQAGLRSVTADLAVVETRPPPGSAPAAGAVRPLRQ